MKITRSLFIIALTAGCSGQTSSKQEIINEDFGWTITIPEGFSTVTAEEWAKMQNKGATAIEKTYGQPIIDQSKTIFVFQSGKLNYFESNYQPFDESVDGNYMATFTAVNKMLYETFISQLPGVKIDTLRTTEKIDQLEFQKYQMEINYPNKLVLHTFMYSRLFGKKEFTVNIMYVDEGKGKKMMESWLASKFEK